MFQGDNTLTKALLHRLTHRKKIYVGAGAVQETIFIRFVVGSKNCELEDIFFAWDEIQGQATYILSLAEEPKNIELFEEKAPNAIKFKVGVEIENFIPNGYQENALAGN